MTNLKVAGLLVGGFIALVGVVLLAIFTTGLIQRETAGFRGDVGAVERTRGSGAFRIEAYNRFYDICVGVQADEALIQGLESELEDPQTSTSRRDQVRASLTAIRASRAEKIAQYNADAAKDYTVGQFQSKRLPYNLNVNQEVTQCAV